MKIRILFVVAMFGILAGCRAVSMDAQMRTNVLQTRAVLLHEQSLCSKSACDPNYCDALGEAATMMQMLIDASDGKAVSE